MATDYARATGAPRTITLAGRQYLVHKLRPSDLGTIEAWLKDRVPDPRDDARKRIEGLPDGIAKHIWDKAAKEAKSWPPRYGSQAANELLFQTYDGLSFMLWVMLRRGLPSMTVDEAASIVDQVAEEEIDAVVALAGFGDPGDPKAQAPMEATAGVPSPSPTPSSATTSPSVTGGPTTSSTT